MADWMNQQISDPDEVDEDEEAEKTQNATEEPEEERTEFERQIRTLLSTNSVESLSVDVIEDNIDECSDVEALRQAAEVEEREEAHSLYQERLMELGYQDRGENDEDVDDVPEVEETEEEATEEEVTEEPELESKEEESAPNPFGGGGSEDAEEESEATEKETEEEEVNPSTGTFEDPPESEPTPDSDNTPNVRVKDIAPDALTSSEAAERERRWTTMVWGEPGLGKSHFGMSATSPVCVIDTEGKADELAHKFSNEGPYDDPFIFQPSDFDGAKEALHQALSLLDAFRQEEEVIGSLVVDSMSVMWGWSQQKYVDKFYPHADDPSEVELQTGFGSGKSDWKQIKNYHNVQFRQAMIDSPYHFVWTAMSEEDYDAQINEGNRDAEKPAGEKENVYKVDEVLRLKEGDDGAPIGELQKSGKIKHRYTGLRYPTFDKHKKLIEAIDEAEGGNGSISNIEAKHGVRIVEGNPAYLKDEDE